MEFIKLLKKMCAVFCHALNQTKQTQRAQVNIRETQVTDCTKETREHRDNKKMVRKQA